METLAVELLALDFTSILATLWNGLLVVLGLGLVIFFHELGHFAVAKWCDVHVERFSIGFGPILWSRQKGETEYALSAIPFGGYVKMLGQDDMDASKTANEDIAQNPRSYSAKKVWQRMAIISAGVIMNIITAAMFFTVAYLFGVSDAPSTVGSVLVGSPAWEASLELGDEITHINGEEMATFTDVSMEVALTDGDIEVKGLHADGTEFTTMLTPDAGSVRQIGIGPTKNNHVIRPLKKEDPVTSEGLPAGKADPPFLPGDKIVGIHGEKVEDFVDVKRILSDHRDKAVEFELQRYNDGKGDGEVVTTKVQPAKFRSLGFTMEIGPVASLQDGPAAKSGMQIGDVIQTVDEKAVGTDVDPLHLNDYFAARARSGQSVKVKVRRPVEGSGDTNVTLEITPRNIPGWRQTPFHTAEPFPAEAIGAAYFVSTRIASVKPGSEADKAGFEVGQKIVKLEIVTTDNKDTQTIKLVPKDENQKADEVNFAVAYWSCQQAFDREIKFNVRQRSEDSTSDKTIAKTLSLWEYEENAFLPIRGFQTEGLMVEQKAESFGEAVSMGVNRTWKNILQIYLTLRGLFTGNISVKELQGPVGIAKIGYAVAEQGPSKLLVFLGFLSVNLAVLNFLPIPVLDGGHMVFLAYEAVAGKKPSERVLIAAQYVGLIMILSLMVFVLGQDFYKLFAKKPV